MADGSRQAQQTIVCMKWGDRYPALYVNTLASMVRRNTRRPTRLVCYTDDASGIRPGIECHPLPPITLPDRVARLPWRKISLWAKSLPGLSGRVLYLDLDVVVTGSLDELFDYRPEASFVVIENWTQPGSGIGNTSVYRFDVGAHPYLLERIERESDAILGRYRNSQTYISDVIGEKVFWPKSWCVSFKHTLLPSWPVRLFKTAELPLEAKVVCFTGKPDPDEARDGRWPAPLYKKFYKVLRPTPWIAEHWR